MIKSKEEFLRAATAHCVKNAAFCRGCSVSNDNFKLFCNAPIVEGIWGTPSYNPHDGNMGMSFNAYTTKDCSQGVQFTYSEYSQMWDTITSDILK